MGRPQWKPRRGTVGNWAGREVRVVAADGEDKLPLGEPHEVGKAAGELAVLVEDVGVAGELGLDGEEAFGGGEAGFEREFDADERGVVGGNGHAGHTEDADLDAAVECDVNDGRDVDDDEGGAVESDGEPEAAALGGDAVADLEQLAHGVVGDRAAIVEGCDQDEAGDLVEVVGDDEFAVVADAEADGFDLDDRRNADDDEQAGEDEERWCSRPGVLGLGVCADGDEAELGDLDQQHAIVFDGGPSLLTSAPATVTLGLWKLRARPLRSRVHWLGWLRYL